MVGTITFSGVTIGTGQVEGWQGDGDVSVFECVDNKSGYGNCCSSNITCLEINNLIVCT
jgi:hypothetical protein